MGESALKPTFQHTPNLALQRPLEENHCMRWHCEQQLVGMGMFRANRQVTGQLREIIL